MECDPQKSSHRSTVPTDSHSQAVSMGEGARGGLGKVKYLSLKYFRLNQHFL